MGRKCSVPGCKSNYLSQHSSHVSVYQFPKDEALRTAWLKRIRRGDSFLITNNMGICKHHFKSDDFKTTSETLYNRYKTPRTRILQNQKLKKDAIPSIFRCFPSYYNGTTNHTINRTDAYERRQKFLLKRDEAEAEKFEKMDTITNDCDFNQFIPSSAPDECAWKVISFDKFTVISCFNVEKKFTVNRYARLEKLPLGLDVTLFMTDSKIKKSEYLHLLTNGIVTKCSQLLNIITFLSNYNIPRNDATIKSCVNVLTKLLRVEEDKSVQGLFFAEQLELMLIAKSEHRRYNHQTLLCAFSLYSLSQSVYKSLLEMKILFLPSVRRLRQLVTTLNVSPGTNESNSTYCNYVFRKLKSYERDIVLIIDEVSVTKVCEYKGGCLSGFVSEKEKKIATSIMAFMVSPVKKKQNEIISLVPTSGVTASRLHQYVLELSSTISLHGLNLVAIVTDNHRINRGVIQKLSNTANINEGSSVSKLTQHNNTYMLIDTVHLIKSVRNNWMKTTNFYFENPESGEMEVANFNDIVQLYDKESSSITKIAVGLGRKSVCPNNLEKQQVKPVTAIFSDNCLCALDMFKENLHISKGTRTFINIISTFWKIANVKCPRDKRHSCDDYRLPIRSTDSIQMRFLTYFHNFLNKWDSLQTSQKLSDMTMSALIMTVNSLIAITKFFLEQRKDSYIMLGNFQSDALESRFGYYRQIGGSRYNMSVNDVLEAEKKIRIKHLISKSKSYGPIRIMLTDMEQMDMHICQTNKSNAPYCELFSDAVIDSTEIELTYSEANTIFTISGFIQRKLNLRCSMCNSLADDEDPTLHFSTINHGRLTKPSEKLHNLCKRWLFIFKTIIGENETEKFFIAQDNHRAVLHSIFTNVSNCNVLHASDETCIQFTSWTCCNIFLKNYCIVANNNFQSKCAEKKINKLPKCAARKINKLSSCR